MELAILVIVSMLLAFELIRWILTGAMMGKVLVLLREAEEAVAELKVKIHKAEL